MEYIDPTLQPFPQPSAITPTFMFLLDGNLCQKDIEIIGSGIVEALSTNGDGMNAHVGVLVFSSVVSVYYLSSTHMASAVVVPGTQIRVF